VPQLSGQTLASHRCGPGSRTGSMWGLCSTKRHWGMFSPSTSVSPANHSTDFSIIIIPRGWHNTPLSGRSVEWILIPPPTMRIKKKYSIQFYSCLCCPDLLVACFFGPVSLLWAQSVMTCGLIRPRFAPHSQLYRSSPYTYLWLMQSTFWPIPHLTRPIFFILYSERTGEEFSRRKEVP
jgi:hypothetical protein